MSTNGDKRSVATDALDTLGTAPIPDGSGRDAIHLAVEPVIAAERLEPGQDIGIMADGRAGTLVVNLVGIVDPFLKEAVEEGEKFWLIVYPREINSLRHVWTHPAFDDEPISESDRERSRRVVERLTGESERWLRDFCDNSDCPSYEQLMEAIRNGGESVVQVDDDDYYTGIRIEGEYLHVSGSDAHGSIPPEFWDHVENITGMKQKNRPSYFSCSC
jgi:hypothetical protein